MKRKIQIAVSLGLVLVVLAAVLLTSSGKGTTLVNVDHIYTRKMYKSLEEVAKDKKVEAVIRGTVKSTKVYVEDETVVTISQVEVDESLYGNFTPGETFQLSEYGGSFSGYEDGKKMGGSIALTTRINPNKVYSYEYNDYTPCEAGDTVILFLEDCNRKFQKQLDIGKLYIPASAFSGKLKKNQKGYKWCIPNQVLNDNTKLKRKQRSWLKRNKYYTKAQIREWIGERTP